MTLKSSRGALLALGIGVALAAGLAPVISGAQTPPQQLPANPPSDERGDLGAFNRAPNRFEERLERRLDFLHSELRINPQQEDLWADFADAVRQESQIGRNQFRDREAFRGDPDVPRPSIVERLERRQQGLEERSAYYDRLLSALRPLYAALNEDQRRAADEHLFAPGRADRFRRGPARFGMFGGGRYRERAFEPFERSFGPYPRYDMYDRGYR